MSIAELADALQLIEARFDMAELRMPTSLPTEIIDRLAAITSRLTAMRTTRRTALKILLFPVSFTHSIVNELDAAHMACLARTCKNLDRLVRKFVAAVVRRRAASLGLVSTPRSNFKLYSQWGPSITAHHLHVAEKARLLQYSSGRGYTELWCDDSRSLQHSAPKRSFTVSPQMLDGFTFLVEFGLDRTAGGRPDQGSSDAFHSLCRIKGWGCGCNGSKYMARTVARAACTGSPTIAFPTEMLELAIIEPDEHELSVTTRDNPRLYDGFLAVGQTIRSNAWVEAGNSRLASCFVTDGTIKSARCFIHENKTGKMRLLYDGSANYAHVMDVKILSAVEDSDEDAIWFEKKECPAHWPLFSQGSEETHSQLIVQPVIHFGINPPTWDLRIGVDSAPNDAHMPVGPLSDQLCAEILVRWFQSTRLTDEEA